MVFTYTLFFPSAMLWFKKAFLLKNSYSLGSILPLFLFSDSLSTNRLQLDILFYIIFVPWCSSFFTLPVPSPLNNFLLSSWFCFVCYPCFTQDFPFILFFLIIIFSFAFFVSFYTLLPNSFLSSKLLFFLLFFLTSLLLSAFPPLGITLFVTLLSFHFLLLHPLASFPFSYRYHSLRSSCFVLYFFFLPPLSYLLPPLFLPSLHLHTCEAAINGQVSWLHSLISSLQVVHLWLGPTFCLPACSTHSLLFVAVLLSLVPIFLLLEIHFLLFFLLSIFPLLFLVIIPLLP